MSELSVKIDFLVVNTKDKKSIWIGDQSQWGVAENLPAYLEILVPGSTRWLTHNFIKKNLHILNSTNLGLSCVTDGCGGQEYEDLPDGVWEFCLKSSFEGLNKKRYYLKSDSLRVEADKVYIKVGLDYDPSKQVIKDLEKFEFFMTASEAYMRRGDHVKAKRAFDEASKLIENYKNCKNCY